MRQFGNGVFGAQVLQTRYMTKVMKKKHAQWMAALSWNASIFSGTRRATALPTPLGFCFSSFSCTPDFTAHTQNYIRTCTQSTFFFFFFFPLSEIETCKRAAAAYGAHFCTSGLMLLSSRLCSAHHCFWMGKTKQLRCCSFAGREWKKHAAIVLVKLGGGGGEMSDR